MIIVDRALERREHDGRPVRVALVGAGFIGRGIARQIFRGFPGLRLVAIANRTLGKAERAYREAGADEIREVSSVSELERAIESGVPAITEDAGLVCEAGPVDLVIEATGEVEFGAGVTIRAIDSGKHVVLMNAEVDLMLGRYLARVAAEKGLVVTSDAGDQHGVLVRMCEEIEMWGFELVQVGNIKGFLNRYATPESIRRPGGSRRPWSCRGGRRRRRCRPEPRCRGGAGRAARRAR